MRLIGLLLLIAVLAVGYGVFKSALSAPSPAPAATVLAPEAPHAPATDARVDELEAQVAELQNQLQQANSAPVAAIDVAQPAEELATRVQEVDTSRPAHGCVALPGNEHGASPALTVAPGHLLSVQWYYDNGPQEQSVLSAGTWQPKAGVRVGAHWDYPACDLETVTNQAVASNGSVTDPSNGFVGS